jgi:hypothetical protein
MDELESRLIEVNAEKFVQRLDKLASGGEYDDVALCFGYSGSSVFNWHEDRLKRVQHWLKRGILPIAFVAVTRRKPVMDIRIWHRSWDVTAEGPAGIQSVLLAVDEVLRRSKNASGVENS